ncbi:MAG: FAD/NAD(P)-binding protein [Pirellulaceae bacterium]|nr:FAD/NAD(P)-binding protein [Pirellulaceae bacterium]
MATESRVTSPMVPTRYRVLRAIAETHDTRTLHLDPIDDDGFAFAPGQFSMLYAFGIGEVPISISGDPDNHGPLVHTIRTVGAVTNVLGELRDGDVIGVRGPYGSAWPVDTSKRGDLVILAGGIGLAPLRPVLYSVLANRDRFGRVVLLYGARSPSEILFGDEIQQWRSRFDLHVRVTVDRASDDWHGHVGVITTLIPALDIDIPNATAMICGPEIMMRYCVKELCQHGFEHEQQYVSMERNMKCAIGHCGHCQYGADFVCKDGPVFRFDKIAGRFQIQEI